MKRNVLSVMASFIIAGTLVGAQNAPAQDQAPAPQAPSAPASAPQAPAPAAAGPSQDNADDTTLKGCLIQGAGPSVFILENAKRASDGADAKGQSYVVAITAKPEQLQMILNSHVEITGTALPKAAVTASSDAKTGKEADLPKLTAKRINRLAATCPASGD
jgi:hypothetical protein